MRRPILASLLALFVAAGLAGCGSSSKQDAGSGTTAAAPATTTAPAPTQTSVEPVVLADGRHPVYIKTVDANARKITFDLIQFFFGDAATKAAAEDHQESPPPNDYYIRNVNSRLRTLPVRPDAPITVNVLAAQATGSATKDVTVTLEKLASWFPNGGTPPFWITVEHGQVAKIAQQYLP
jgi:hypothetical protein